jgi:hypothetical protein
MKLQILIAIFSLMLAILIFTFTEGARIIYRGGFFALLGISNLLMTAKKKA